MNGDLFDKLLDLRYRVSDVLNRFNRKTNGVLSISHNSEEVVEEDSNSKSIGGFFTMSTLKKHIVSNNWATGSVATRYIIRSFLHLIGFALNLSFVIDMIVGNYYHNSLLGLVGVVFALASYFGFIGYFVSSERNFKISSTIMKFWWLEFVVLGVLALVLKYYRFY